MAKPGYLYAYTDGSCGRCADDVGSVEVTMTRLARLSVHSALVSRRSAGGRGPRVAYWE